MLVELRIRNLLLITAADLEFTLGFNALTGETGAGKSLLVDALSFLLGAHGGAEMVRPGAAQAEVSARFLLADRELADACAEDLGIAFEEAQSSPAELVLSRTLPRTGRPRAYANGCPIALPALKSLAERLVDIHGQHENQSLLRPATRLEILDLCAEASAERAAVRQCHADALEAARGLADLRRAARERQGREDMLRFQLQELDEARLDEMEPERMESEVRLLRDAEKIRAAALAAGAALDSEDGESAAALLARAVKSFDALGDAGPGAGSLRERMHGLLAELRETARDAENLAGQARSNPERLADLEERRHRLRALERKHGRDLPALAALQQKLRAGLSDLEQLETRTEERENLLSAKCAALRHAAEKLSRKRKSAARDLEKRVNQELAGLGLKDARLEVALVPHPAAPAAASNAAASGGPAVPEREAALPGSLDEEAQGMLPANLKSSGAESAELLFSANPGLPLRPLRECASGGEIARVMLALKGVLARRGGADRLPVVIFDEIDAGVGGRLGSVLGRKLRDLAKVRQVLCVTHQPQVAASAQRQFKIEKKTTVHAASVTVTLLEGPRRVDELAQMLRGESASALTRKEAEAMLREAQD